MFVGVQRCNGRGCLTCPALFNDSTIKVNDKKLELDGTLTCKDKNVIYVAQCQLCPEGTDRDYIGQTGDAFHIRNNNHRSCFKTDTENDKKVYQLDALSQHWNDKHKDNAERMEIFRLGIVKQTAAISLNEEEEKYCSCYKTQSNGLNRMTCGCGKAER